MTGQPIKNNQNILIEMFENTKFSDGCSSDIMKFLQKYKMVFMGFDFGAASLPHTEKSVVF